MTRNQTKRIAAFKDDRAGGIAQRKEGPEATAMDYQNKNGKKNRKKSLDQKRHGTTPMQQRKEGPMEKGPMQEEEQGQIHDNADDDDDDDAFINKLASDLDDSYQEVWDAVFKKGVDDLDEMISPVCKSPQVLCSTAKYCAPQVLCSTALSSTISSSVWISALVYVYSVLDPIPSFIHHIHNSSCWLM